LVFELQNKAEKIEISPEVLQQLTDKLNVINHLTQKHRVATIDDLLQIRENLQSEQSGLEGLQENINSTQKEIAAQEDKLNSLAEKIAVNRKKYSVVFVEKMELLLQQLGLEKAKLEVSLLPNPNFTLYGKENISILFQANTGFALKPIQNAISGGERSRVMLAVKKIMAENTALPTLILDEIDTGVSGKVADEMGKVMKEMSQDLQLIVISHLAQVAAKGDTNYKVIKSEVMGKTQSQIIPLSAEEKLQEIAQLLSGTVVTDAALQQAKELMK
jgi:DNA repair protein RecN (Recombination protein N)